MSQGVTTRWFAEPCFAHGRLHCILQILFMRVMASFDSRAWINGAPSGWKNILPRPFTGSAWKFSLQRLGQMDAAKSVRQILLMLPFHLFKMSPQRWRQAHWQHRLAFRPSFRLAHGDVQVLKIDIFNA